MSTKVVHCKREKYDVYIGRPSKWGNTFVVGRDGTREEVIRKFEEWLRGRSDLLHDIGELRNKTLGCWCSPKACHGDVLAKLANAKSVEAATPVSEKEIWAEWSDGNGGTFRAGRVKPEAAIPVSEKEKP